MSLQGNVFKLANGQTIPAVAYGAGTKWYKYGSSDVSQPLIDSIKYAVGHGFSHIDGALIYGTDPELGAALSSIDRSLVFVTNKYFGSIPNFVNTEHENPLAALKALKVLKTDYVDLYLLHHPFLTKEANGFDLKEAWKFMEQAVDEGLAKSIGVSNFTVEDLKVVLESARIQPVAHQIEFNAYLQDQTPGIVEFCQDKGILIEAYSPLAPLFQTKDRGELTDYLDELAKKYSKTASQVLLRWVLERGALPVTTSSNETRIAQLNDLFDFELNKEEVNKISELGKKHPTLRLYWNEQYSKYN